jgi:hypothetical protein
MIFFALKIYIKYLIKDAIVEPWFEKRRWIAILNNVQ